RGERAAGPPGAGDPPTAGIASGRRWPGPGPGPEPAVIRLGKDKRRAPDQVLEAVDSLLAALRESSRRIQDATRQAQTIRRLRSHGRSYAEILAQSPASSAHRISVEALQATVHASEGLDRAEVRALKREGVAVDRIAVLCGMTEAQTEVLIEDAP
ncbi:MAG: hypothetical protein ACRD2W_22915, partial [Acidimicrobiales bacterium]